MTITLPDMDKDWTWMDDDRSIAWGDPSSYHGKLAAAYQTAGWQGCYHDYGRTVFHFNVKRRGMFNVFRKVNELALAETDTPEPHMGKFEQFVENADERAMESFWMSFLDDEYLYDADTKSSGLADGDYWQDGRSGGWFHVSNVWAAHNPDLMLKLANYLSEMVDYYGSDDYAEYLYETAWERFLEWRYEHEAVNVVITISDEEVKAMAESGGAEVSMGDIRRFLTDNTDSIHEVGLLHTMDYVNSLLITASIQNHLEGGK